MTKRGEKSGMTSKDYKAQHAKFQRDLLERLKNDPNFKAEPVLIRKKVAEILAKAFEAVVKEWPGGTSEEFLHQYEKQIERFSGDTALSNEKIN